MSPLRHLVAAALLLLVLSAAAQAQAPTISSINPAAGSVEGASTTISGDNLATATSVTFDGVSAAFEVVTFTGVAQLFIQSIPPHAAGSVDVIVTTPGDSVTLSNGYTYVPAPTISSLSPAAGPPAGGTQVTIAGGALLTTTAVLFDDIEATIVSRADSQLVVTTPANASLGAVNVEIFTAAGSVLQVDGYTYGQPQSIDFPPILAQQLPGGFTASATANSTLLVSFSSLTPAVCTATGPRGATITLVAAGTCTLEATQAGDASWLAAAPVQRSFAVSTDPAEIEFIEGDLAAGLIAPNALRLVSGQFGGDAQPDLAVLREDNSIALWIRDATQESGFGLVPASATRAFGSALYFAMLSFDAHGDGGRDLGFVTRTKASDPNTHIGALLSQGAFWNPSRTNLVATADAESPQLRRLRRMPLPNGRDQVMALSGGESALLYAVPTSATLGLVATLSHPGGAFDAVPVFYGDNSERPALLTLGAPPQRLWRYVPAQNGYVAQAFSGIDRNVRQAVSLSLAPGTDPRIVTVSADNKVEVWQALAPTQAGGPPAGYELLDDLTPPGVPRVNFVDTIDLAPGARFHLLLGVDGEDDTTETRVYRVTQGEPGDGFTHTETWQGGLSFVRSGDVAFVGDRIQGIRSYVPRVVPEPGPVTPITVKMSADKYYDSTGLFADDPVVYLVVVADQPVDRDVNVRIQHRGASRPLTLYKGQRSASTSYKYMFQGTYGFTLSVESDPFVTVASPSAGDVVIVDWLRELLAQFDEICALLNAGPMPVPGKAEHDDPATFMPTAEIEVMRDFRDRVLDETLAGREFEALYYHFSEEFFTGLFATPTFFVTAYEAKQAWMPLFTAMAQGNNNVIVTADMLERMDQVFEHYRQHGSRELREAIEFHYPRLDPHSFEGKTGGELFDHLVDLPPMQAFKDGFETPTMPPTHSAASRVH